MLRSDRQPGFLNADCGFGVVEKVGRPDSEPPIVVDLDRTLINTDLLIDSFFALLASRPKAAFAALIAIGSRNSRHHSIPVKPAGARISGPDRATIRTRFAGKFAVRA